MHVQESARRTVRRKLSKQQNELNSYSVKLTEAVLCSRELMKFAGIFILSILANTVLFHFCFVFIKINHLSCVLFCFFSSEQDPCQ